MHRKDDKRETVAIEGYEIEEKPKKKVEKETIKTEIPDELRPKFNVVGSIDLEEPKKQKKETEVKSEEKEIKAEEPVQKEVEEKPVTPKTVEPEEIVVPHDEKPVEPQTHD